MPKIELAHLSKYFGGVAALDDLTLMLDDGNVLALLGPNGAGKTTTLRLIMGFLKPTHGTVRFDGGPLTPAVLEGISFVPETTALYDDLTGADHIEWYRRSYKRFDMKRARELTDRFSLDSSKRVRTLSKGQQTALALVLAFANDAQTFVLDEPTSGLDPIHQQGLRDLIVDASTAGATVILSSHHVRSFESIADCVAILRRGALKIAGTIDDLKAQFRVVDLALKPDANENGLANDARVLWMRRDGRLLRIAVRSEGEEFERSLASLGSIVQMRHFNLEEIFMEAVGQHELR